MCIEAAALGAHRQSLSPLLNACLLLQPCWCACRPEYSIKRAADVAALALRPEWRFNYQVGRRGGSGGRAGGTSCRGEGGGAAGPWAAGVGRRAGRRARSQRLGNDLRCLPRLVQWAFKNFKTTVLTEDQMADTVGDYGTKYMYQLYAYLRRRHRRQSGLLVDALSPPALCALPPPLLVAPGLWPLAAPPPPLLQARRFVPTG